MAIGKERKMNKRKEITCVLHVEVGKPVARGKIIERKT
jgi:hypothetical protein